METTVLITSVISFLKPYLIKAGEKVAETVGERLGDQTLQRGVWNKVKSFFNKDEEKKVLEEAESDVSIGESKIEKIENLLTSKLDENVELKKEISSILNFSDMFLIEQLVKSIATNKEKLVEYFEERNLAGIETEGSYDIMIARTRRRLTKDEKELGKLLAKGMDAPSEKSTSLKELVMSDRIVDALEIMREKHPDDAELIMTSARFNRLRTQSNSGVISNGDYQIEIAKITRVVLEMIDEKGWS